MLIEFRSALLSIALIGQVFFSAVSVAATPEIAAGELHVLALHSNGSVSSWGSNNVGLLSNGTPLYEKNNTPMQVKDSSGNPLVDAIDIAVGDRHSLALMTNGSLLAWGSNASGAIGDGTTINRTEPVEVMTGVRAIAANGAVSLALKTDGTVWAWGQNSLGQLGNGTTTVKELSPVRVGSLTDVTAIATSGISGYALKSDGTVWGWGSNASGLLGDGTTTHQTTPVQVSNLNGVTAIAAGDVAAYALKSNGTVWAWGSNSRGRLGNGSTSGYSTTPTQVINLTGITNISAYADHVLVVRSDSTVWGWGYSYNDQLGDVGGQISVGTPVQITGLTGNESRVEVGYLFSFALSCDGSLRGWGFNTNGVLGNGTFTSTATPVQAIGVNGEGNLSLGDTCSIPPPSSDDHGDSAETATEINVDSSTAGSLEVGGDVDYFKLIIASDTTVTLQSTGSTDTYGKLLDAASTVLAENDDGGAGTNFLLTMPLTAGTYYVVVKGGTTTVTGNYTLVSESSGGGTPPPPPPPSDDHGDNTEAATVINANSSTAGSLETGGDNDYFKLVLSSEATVTLQTTGTTDTYGTLLDASATVLAQNDDGGAGTNFQITTSLSAGTYYVVVRGYNTSTTGDYTLVAESTGGGSTSDDHGDTTETATLISADSSTPGSLEVGGDNDGFKLVITVDTTVTLQTTGGTDTYGFLTDATLNVLAANDDDGAGYNFLITISLTPGTYYVVVRGYDGSTTGDYTLLSEVQHTGPNSLAAALLPSSRSVQVGSTATTFATVINAGTEVATGCSIAPVTTVPATFSYQTTDPATNALSGSPDTPVNIAAGAYQTYMFAFTPTGAFAPTDVELGFDCSNTQPAGAILGVNTLLLSASDTPVADIIAMAATPSHDGILKIPSNTTGANAFVVATANVGTGETITAAADTGSATLPLSLFICETEPSTGACLAAPAASVTTTITDGATPTFAVFGIASGGINLDPANNRIFVRFKDDGGLTRGSTSVAVQTIVVPTTGPVEPGGPLP